VELANKKLFPGAITIINNDFDNINNINNINKKITVTKDDYIIIVTSGHINDFYCAAFALKTEASYIGIIGSKKKLAYIKEKLNSEKGIDEKEFMAERVHAPIGLDIGSETPLEVAVSVSAELIATRAARNKKQISNI
jgi:xanthine dehydrogenase accessory factor